MSDPAHSLGPVAVSEGDAMPMAPLDTAGPARTAGVRGAHSRDPGVVDAAPPARRGKLTNMLGPADESTFTFADLFAGIGGFHAVLGALGGRAAFASEIDPVAGEVYRRNWEIPVYGDIVPLTTGRMDVPDHDVLAAGLHCQSFSNSGLYKEMVESCDILI